MRNYFEQTCCLLRSSNLPCFAALGFRMTMYIADLSIALMCLPRRCGSIPRSQGAIRPIKRATSVNVLDFGPVTCHGDPWCQHALSQVKVKLLPVLISDHLDPSGRPLEFRLQGGESPRTRKTWVTHPGAKLSTASARMKVQACGGLRVFQGMTWDVSRHKFAV